MTEPIVSIKNLDFGKFVFSGNLVEVPEGTDNSQKFYVISNLDPELRTLDIPVIAKTIQGFDPSYAVILHLPNKTKTRIGGESYVCTETKIREIINPYAPTYVKVEGAFQLSITLKSDKYPKLYVVGNPGNETLEGKTGKNWMSGGDGDDFISGDHDDDWLNGNDGNDRLVGRGGNDILDGGLGDDKLYGKTGHDDLYGDEGNDSLWGDEGDDYLSGGPGDDFLSGDSGDDVLFGGDGNDELHGGQGNDWLDGGRGDDTYVIQGQIWGEDVIFDTRGHNKVIFTDTPDSDMFLDTLSPVWMIKKDGDHLVISRPGNDNKLEIRNFFIRQNAQKFSFYNSSNQKYTLDPQNAGNYSFSLASK